MDNKQYLDNNGEPRFESPIPAEELQEVKPESEEISKDEQNLQKLADAANRISGIENATPKYDRRGFDENGIHKDTGTEYDPEGYDKYGFDDIGVDREGFDRDGYGTDERDRYGYDREGYDQHGYDIRGFDHDGIHRDTGTEYNRSGYNKAGYDKDGYGRDGYDKDGFNRHGRDYQGFDREGFYYNGRDREGYDRDGYDKYGFNRDGINKDTGTEYDSAGFNKERINKETGTRRDSGGYDIAGYDKNGLDRLGFNRQGYNVEGYDKDGFDIKGRDRDGYDREGYSSKGFNREGINKKTGTQYSPAGFNVHGIHELTGDIFNPEGYDVEGYDRDGYDKHGFNRDGINKDTGTELDSDGYNAKGIKKEQGGGFRSYSYDRQGFRGHFSHGEWVRDTKYNEDGFDSEGFNRSGYDVEGFDRDGFDKEGYNREGKDRNGYTREYNAMFNKYGVDENGYQKNGEMDPDVAFAIDFAKSGIRDQYRYASENGLEEKDVRKKIETARKKCPNIDIIVRDVLMMGNKMRMATVASDCEKFTSGSLGMTEFWQKHPKLEANTVLNNFIETTKKKKEFADKIIEGLDINSDTIEDSIRIFSTSKYDVGAAIEGLGNFKREYSKYGTDGSKEQIRQKHDNTIKLYRAMKLMSYYKNRNIDSLVGTRISKDDGKTWLEFDGTVIGEALDALKNDKRLICTQTVRDYIVKRHYDSEQ